MDLILDERHTKVIFHEDARFLEVRIEGRVPSGDFKFAHQHTLQFAEANHVHRILINESKLEKLDPLTVGWLLTNYIPNLFLKLGFKLKLAIVKSETYFTRTTNQLSALAFKKLKSQFQIEFFNTPEDAQSWLTGTQKYLE
ncbi:hypothetical protein AAG747_26315 [Rapidithrix thailandica]|uniref:STAS/SEC14 domain-containing protein n=1 Tax=Rapidithrix thailandica TaxID=413964 RepID=A0AAW9S2P2_9BACT